jgi:hypothetical protein
MRFGGSTQGPNWAVFFASLALVGTWGDQPPSGVVGGGGCGSRGGAPAGPALAFAPGRAAGPVFRPPPPSTPGGCPQ